jgi:hypothetical protein
MKFPPDQSHTVPLKDAERRAPAAAAPWWGTG